jgi:hypothetical protein
LRPTQGKTTRPSQKATRVKEGREYGLIGGGSAQQVQGPGFKIIEKEIRY